MFIDETPLLVGADSRLKEIRQAQIRSHTASAGHRARLNQKAAGRNASVIADLPCQPEKTSTFRVHGYRANHSRSNSGESSPKTDSTLVKTRGNGKKSNSACVSILGRVVVHVEKLPTSFPIEQIQSSLLAGPSCHTPTGIVESRAIHFFIVRTAVEWAGWLDEQIWRNIAIQMSMSQPALKHALVSLALYHEHLETQDVDQRDDLWQQSFAQGRQALDLLVQDHDDMPISAVIMVYFAVTAFTSLLDNETAYQALQMQYDLLDRNLLCPGHDHASGITASQEDLAHYLAFVLRRRRDRHGRVTDMLWSLTHAPLHNFAVEETVIIPEVFASLRHARQILETLLKRTTYQIKIRGSIDSTLPPDAQKGFKAWLENLQTFICTQARSDDEIQSGAILKICGKLGFMLIEVMYETNEMAFDKYTHLFRELAVVFDQNTVYRRRMNRANMTFILDSGLICYVGHAALRWCRDPTIRQRLIDLLSQSQRQEGIEPAQAWAGISRYIKMIEEIGISPAPEVSSDIPGHRRLRCISYDYFWKSQLVHVKYLQPPWQEEVVQDVWLSYAGQDFCFSLDLAVGEFPSQHDWDDEPDLHFSRGRVSWKIKGSNQYYTFRTLDFHFPLPRS